MWPLKQPKVYQASRASRIGMVVMWALCTAILASLYVHAGYRLLAILPSNRFDGMPLGLLWTLFWATSVGMFFRGESLTIAPDEVVLRQPFVRLRIRQDDIAGRRKERNGSYAFDVIVSRQRPDLAIAIPLAIPRDTALTMWLHALPDLDRGTPAPDGTPKEVSAPDVVAGRRPATAARPTRSS